MQTRVSRHLIEKYCLSRLPTKTYSEILQGAHHPQRCQRVQGVCARVGFRGFEHAHFLQTIAIGGHDQRHDLVMEGGATMQRDENDEIQNACIHAHDKEIRCDP
jgi:hypothetical protein